MAGIDDIPQADREAFEAEMQKRMVSVRKWPDGGGDYMRRSGFPCWPHWAETAGAQHLTKLGAQNWLRHLFALESAHGVPGRGEGKA